MRTGEFVINFINKDYFDACIATINHNDDETDEFEAGGFHKEQAKTVVCPRMQEAFLSLECRFEREIDLSGSGKASLVIGKVNHIAMQKEYAKGIDGKYEVVYTNKVYVGVSAGSIIATPNIGDPFDESTAGLCLVNAYLSVHCPENMELRTDLPLPQIPLTDNQALVVTCGGYK